MAVTTKRKVGVKKETVTVRRERLRLRDWMLFWILVLANVALVCAIFGNIDVNTLKPVSVVNEEQQSAEQQLVDELKAQLKDLGDKMTDIDQEQHTYNEFVQSRDIDFECRTEGREPGQPETYFTYIDTETGVSMTLPYSFSWGTSNCPPLRKESLQEIRFGPVTPSEDNPMRDASLRILEVADLRNRRIELTDGPNGSSDVRERVVNGMTVLSYKYEGLGSLSYWEAFGRNFRYLITSRSWLTDSEAIKIIQSLRVTK